jgi:hypothetical protein
MDKQPFLRWLLVTTLSSVAMVILWQAGVLGEIWSVDSSYLSAVTLAFFWVVTIICGHATWRACDAGLWWNTAYDRRRELFDLRGREELGWFGSEMCLVLGMMGTIVGFIMMLSGFNALDLSNVQTIQGLLSDLGKSMGTALYTTIVGLVCGSILKIQCFNLARVLDKAEEEALQ